MKKWQKLMVFVLAVILLFGISTNDVEAAEKKAYTYQITFFAGNVGTFTDTDGLVISNQDAVVTLAEDKLVVSGLNLGDVVAFNAQANMKLDAASKHYVQGVRLSGYDNDTVAASVFVVERDRDYVVAYGIKGNMASYTIKYQDNYGNTLAPDEVYYGNVGDKPVVPYLYIDGYVPRYMGLTKTLSANNAENLFVFIYDRAPEDEAPTLPGTDTEGTDSEGTTTGGGTGGTVGTGGNAGAGNAGTGGTGTTPGTEVDTETPDDTEDGQNTEDGTNDNEDQNTGAENEGDNEDETEEDSIIIDLDDEEVPLANVGQDSEDTEFGLKMLGCIALGAVALGLLSYIIVLLMKRRTKESEA